MDNSLNQPKNKIAEIVTEYSQIRRVLAKPLVQPSDSATSQEREKVAAVRDQQLKERERFVLRYEKAIKAFLGKKLGNLDKVEQVYAFFIQKCMEGKLSNYDPAKASFRKYLKTVLRNSCYEYARQNAAEDNWVQMETGISPTDNAIDQLADQAFNQKLIETIFRRALDSIENVDHLYFITIKLITEATYRDIKPPSSSELASILSANGGRPISEENARKIKSRAKKVFAKRIILEVGELIGTDNLDELENALIDIGILQYCKKALAKMRKKQDD